MRNPSATLSPMLTVNGAAYTLEVSGYGQISNDGWIQTENLNTAQGDWTLPTTPGYTLTGGSYSAGNGFTPGQFLNPNDTFRIEIIFGSPVEITSVQIHLSALPPGNVYPQCFGLLSGVLVIDDNFRSTAPSLVYGCSFAAGTIDTLIIGIASIGGALTGYLPKVIIGGNGDNPFTGDPGGAVFADAYYRVPGGIDANAELFEPTAGLLIDGSAPAVAPPYDPSHLYRTPFVGTGNQVNSVFALADYTGVQNRALTLTLCRNP